MKIKAVEAAKLLLKFIYFFMKLLPQKNRIVMLSRETDTIPVDFVLLKEELNKQIPEYDIKVYCELLSSKNVSVVKVALNTLKSMLLLATSKLCIIDTYSLPVCVLKHKENLKVLQIWHALGGIKISGYATLDKPGGHSSELAKALCMHKNYDYIFSASEKTSELYRITFGCDKNKIYKLGMPRIDYILDGGSLKKENIQKIKNKYPVLSNGKKNILYAPTFRENSPADLSEILKTVDFNKYNLVVKIHDVDKFRTLPENVVNVNEKLFDLFPFAEYNITDYSAASVEASLSGKQLFFYTYDIDEYLKERGLFVNPLKEYPGISSKSFSEIYGIIENGNYDYSSLERFKNTFVQTADTKNTERIVKKIQEILK